MSGPIRAGESFDKTETKEIIDTFHQEGFVYIPGVLEPEEISALKDRTDELLDDPVLAKRENLDLSDRHYVQTKKDKTGEALPFILRNTIELDSIFRDMLVREPILGLAEAIVGQDCKFCGQNVLRNLPGLAIERWHVDGAVHFPVPDDVPRHDQRIRPPVLWITVQMALTDIDTLEQGPTQYVPGSHWSGKNPNDQDHPSFEGNEPVSLFCKAGDIYIQDPQCWHRGAPNTSDRTRYIMQSQYAISWAWIRFGWANRVPIPEKELLSTSDRILNLLGGRHPETTS